ncbi:MAG: toll/interleukin-1 receptor domain-containing protein, partial [Chloroflexi bacterium]|nr:toll/interleukin-1 receptor domain-containing protein [Chloroflexota bacterium]
MIYIAYATNDAAIVPMIVSQLEGAGLESWHRTEDWQPEIDARLAAADTLLAVMSPFARATDSVAYEWATALAQGTPVLLLILRATDLHPRQENLPTFDFTGGPQWEDLLAALQRNAGQPAQSPDEPAAEPAAQPASDVLAGAPDMV